MKKYLLILTAFAISLAACVQEENVQDGKPAVSFESVQYEAGFADEAQFKTGLNEDWQQYWHSLDSISLFRSTANEVFSFNGLTGDRTGTFSSNHPGRFYAGNALETPYTYALYPYDMFNAISEDGELSAFFPYYQEYAPGSFGPKSAPMVAVTEDNSLQFKNLAGFIVVPIYGNVKLKSVTLIADSITIAGYFAVHATPGGIPEVGARNNGGSNFIEIYPNVQLSMDQPTEIWFALPPVTLEGGFTIRCSSDDRGRLYQTTTVTRTIERNVVHRMEPIEFAVESPFADYSYMGKGSYSDAFTDAYHEFNIEVNIYQSNADSRRFRVEAPYAQYYNDNPDAVPNAGANEYVDFFLTSPGDMPNAEGEAIDREGVVLWDLFATERYTGEYDIYALPASFHPVIATAANYARSYVKEYQENGLPGLVVLNPYWYVMTAGGQQMGGFGFQGEIQIVFPGYTPKDYNAPKLPRL